MTQASPQEAVESRPKPQALATYGCMALACGLFVPMTALARIAPNATFRDHASVPHFGAIVVTGVLLGVLVGVALVGGISAINRRAFRRAGTGGFSWRGVLDRTHHAPWSEVVEAHHVVESRDGFSGFTEVELRSGRRVRLMDSWDGADALFRRIMRGSSRGAYRSAANEEECPILFPYGSAHTRSEWRTLPLRVGLVVALVGAPLASALAAAFRGLRVDAPWLAALLASGGSAALGGLVRLHLRAREGWRDEVLAVDRNGIEVRGARAPRQIAWREVRAIVVGEASLHVDTTSGPLPVLPGLDGSALLLRLVLREAPPEVAARHRRDEFTRRLLAPTDRPDGTRRHHAKTRGHRRAIILLASALVTLACCAAALRAAIGSLAEWAVVAVVGGPLLLAIAASYAAWMARFHITIAPDGFVWQGLLTRRTCRWQDVAEVELRGEAPTGLVLKLRDGTTLACGPRDIADGDLLVDAVRRRCAAVLRETP